MIRASTILILIATLVSCQATRVSPADVQRMLDTQAECWNRGDLRGFVDSYWDDDRLTFVGSSGLERGRGDLLAGYERAYATAETRGTLTFRVHDVRELGTSHALVVGSFHLARPDVGDDEGMFTLVVGRHGDELRIEHDHSSASPPPKDPR